MAKTYEADGERWNVYLSKEPAHTGHEGVRPLIFHCDSNTSFGWRVVEVPAAEYGSPERVDSLTGQELDALFERSQPFDYPIDPKAREGHIGDSGSER